MRQTVAKTFRVAVYGDHVSAGDTRRYHRDPGTGTIHAEPMRKRYQQLKLEHVVGISKDEPVKQRNARLKRNTRHIRRKKAKENALQ